MLYDASFSSPTILNFNSKDRIGGSNSNFVSAPYDLGLNKYDSVCLVQASIPKSYFNMPTNYNEFIFRETDSNGVNFDTTITIPIGNYNKINLASKLQTLLNTAQNFGNTYTVTNPISSEPDDFRFTFTLTRLVPPEPVNFSLIFDDTSPFRQLGFEPNSINVSTSVIINVVSQIKSTNAINLAYILRAFIKTNMVQNANDSILEEILSIGSYPTSSLVYYQQLDFNMNTREFNQSSINSWNFILVDSFDQEIDLNGISWAFSIVFFSRNKTHELHKQELQIVNEERIFKIEKEQRLLQDQFKGDEEDKLITVNGIQLADTKANPMEPIYPVYPFTSGLAFSNEPEIVYPTK